MAYPQDQQYPPNYFQASQDSVGGLKYRVDPRQEIQEVVDTFMGVQRDKFGRLLENQKTWPLMNEEGIARSLGWLRGMVTKMTHLTKYENEDRINRQIRHYIRSWLYIIVKERKRWEIKDMVAVLVEVEKLIHESMLRGEKGFEANLTAKQYQVSELIKAESPRATGVTGWFGRKQPTEDNYG